MPTAFHIGPIEPIDPRSHHVVVAGPERPSTHLEHTDCAVARLLPVRVEADGLTARGPRYDAARGSTERSMNP